MFRIQLIVIGLLLASVAGAFPASPVYVGDVGARTVTVTNSGPLGGTQVTTMPIGASQRFKVWFSPITHRQGASVNKGSESACPDPCGVSLNTELGQVGRMYEITDSTGTSYSPSQFSSWEFLRFTPQPDLTAPFTIPLPIHGFRNFTKYLSFSVPPGEATNDLSVLLWMNNLRDGVASVVTNNGTEHVIEETQLLDTVSNGTVCTTKTAGLNPFVAGDVLQFNQFNRLYAAGGASLNVGTWTVLSSPAPTSSSFSVTCGLPANTYGQGDNSNRGHTATKSFRYLDERRWWGGLHGNHQALQLSVPVGPGEFTANATNRLGIRFLGMDYPHTDLVDGLWALDWNLIHAPILITQIVVSGATATATLNSSVPASWTTGRTVYIWDAPGPRWRFIGRHVITGVSGSTFTFAWGSDIPGETPGVAPYTTVDGTYTVPTSRNTGSQSQPAMYAALTVVPESSFQYIDPSTFNYGSGNAATGLTLMTTSLPGVSSTGCAGCHSSAVPGYDHKYFNAPPEVIKIGGMGVGRSEAEMNDIITYIGTIPVPSTRGRWWNPTYQPCPGVNSRPAGDWAAGCGQEWVLTYDNDLAEYITPGGSPPDWTIASGASWAKWYPNQDINIRELPMPVIFPFWLRWLPGQQPENYYSSLGAAFTSGSIWGDYAMAKSVLVMPAQLSASINATATTITTTTAYACASNDFHQIESGADTPEYVKITAGCNTTTLTAVRGCTPIPVPNGSCSGTGSPHTSAAYLADWTAYRDTLGRTQVQDYFQQVHQQEFTNFETIYKMAVGSSPIIRGPSSWSGCEYPTPYVFGYYALDKWISVRAWEIVNVYRLQDMYDTTTRDFYGQNTVNGRAAPQYTRGWFSYSPFGNGPHKDTGCDTYFMNTGQVTSQNHDLDSAIWYIMADIVNNDNRLNHQTGSIDWNYYQNFNHTLSYYRPMFFLQLVQVPYQTQQTMGWPSLTFSGASGMMSLDALQWGAVYTFNFQDAALFTPTARIQDAVEQIAKTYAQLVGMFSSSAWNTYIGYASFNTCQGSQTPSVTRGNVYASCLSDYVAYGLAFMKYYGVDSVTLNTLVAWANSITNWTGSYNFNSAITTASCTAAGDTVHCIN